MSHLESLRELSIAQPIQEKKNLKTKITKKKKKKKKTFGNVFLHYTFSVTTREKR